MASDRAAPEEQPEKQVGEMMQKLKIVSVPEPEPAATEEKASSDGKKVSAPDGTLSEPTSSVTSLGDSGSTKGSEVEQEPMAEQGVYYPPNNYYGVVYPGYEVMGNEWDEQGGIVGVDGMEYTYAGIQAENGSLVYYMPGYGYPQPAYNPYNPYIPGAVYGIDGQFLAPQHYYAGPIFQQPFTPPAYFQPPVAYGSEVPPAFSWDSGLVVAANGNGVNGGTPPGVPKTNTSLPAAPLNVPYSKVTSAARKSVDSKGSAVTSEGRQSPSIPTGGQPAPQGNVPYIAPQRPLNKIPHHVSPIQPGVLPKGYVPLGKVTPSQGKATVLYTDHIGDVKANGHEWLVGDRLKMRGRVPNGSVDVLNEQNRGPRINKTRNPWLSSADTTDVDQEGAENEVYSPLGNRDQYNLPDFTTKYENALFFVIKSYSEDDVHKSIKYNVWASTPNGNKRLDSAHQAAKDKSGGKPGGCPVFLFFSVNASGQFCGVAEMNGPVDFNKSMNFWQQDKWNGFFPVKWHIIKDVPNSQFRHIILENNDNKPVTNSRDTQEIKFAQGIEMLNIFKNYSLKTSILDDFMFYENRQKTMQDKKRQPYHQEQILAAGRFDAPPKKGFGDQPNKADGELKASANGIQVSASILLKQTIEATVEKRDQIVDIKKGESDGTHNGIQKERVVMEAREF